MSERRGRAFSLLMGGGWAAVPGAWGAQDVGHLVSSKSPASPLSPAAGTPASMGKPS